jgi:DNA-directed RNA polymerase subunit E'/Rpb7
MSKKENQIFVNSLLQDKIKIPAKYLSKNRIEYILQKLKQNENKCSKHGFIKENSINISEISLGNIDYTGFQGSVIYNVKYKAKVCNPLIGSIINAHVDNINQFGLLCCVKNENSNNNILEIIIPKKSINIRSDIDLDQFTIGDNITINLLGKKFHINDKSISGIGTVIQKKSSVVKLDTNNSINNKNIDEIDSDSDDIEVDEDDSDNEDTTKNEEGSFIETPEELENEEENEDEDIEDDEDVEIDDESEEET